MKQASTSEKFIEYPGRKITSVTELLDFLAEVKAKEEKASCDHVFYYRGHCEEYKKLQPSVFRKKTWKKNEEQMINDILLANPHEFKDDETLFEKLVRMQHYGLPTRLLDISSNPLASLFFAVERDNGEKAIARNDAEKKDGEFFFFSILKHDVHTCDDCSTKFVTNSIVTQNIPFINHEDFRELIKDFVQMQTDFYANILKEDSIKHMPDKKKREKMRLEINEYKEKFNESIPEFNDKCYEQNVYTLLDDGTKKLAVQPFFKLRFLTTYLCVRPSMKNSRVLSQAGAFILFGLIEELINDNNPELISRIHIHRVVIDGQKKGDIREELENLNINQMTMYPDIEHTALHIKSNYEKL